MLGIISVALWLAVIWWYWPGRLNKVGEFMSNLSDLPVFVCQCIGLTPEYYALRDEVFGTDPGKLFDKVLNAIRFRHDPRTLLSENTRKWYDRYMAHKALQRGEVKA